VIAMLSFIEMSVYGGIMILAIAIIRALLISKLPKRAFVILWLAAILRLILPFELPFAGSVYSLAKLFRQDEVTESPVFEDITIQSEDIFSDYYYGGYRQYPRVEAGSEPSSEADGGIKLPWEKIIYFAVAMALAGYFGISYAKNIRRFRSSLPLSDWDISHRLGNIEIPKGIQIRQSDEISAPLTYGVFRPVILLPKLILDGKDSESKSRLLDFALMHELTHIRRFDPAIKLLAIAVCCVHWFNPAVWLMAWLLNRDIELSCDERVVSAFGTDSRADYANALISLEEKRSGVPIYTGFCRNAVQERITAIMKTKKIGVISALAACLVVACTIGAFATSADKPDINSVTELDVIATGTGDGDLSTYRYSDDGGKTYMTEQELMDKYGFDGVSWNQDVEWWTYDEFKAWLENEKIELQKCLGSSFTTPSRGEVVWTQEEIDNAIAMYEDMLENIKNGALYSKDLDGGIVLCTGTGDGEFDYEISTHTELSDMGGNAYYVYQSKFFPEYEALGLRYNKSEDALYFGGEMVGYFYDEYKPGAYVRSLMDGGEIGVVALRDGSGKLISLKKTDVPEFNFEATTTEGAVPSSYESEQLTNEEVIKAYGGYGISFNADGMMLYNDQPVRYFCDGVEVGDGFASKYVYLNQLGKIDVYTVREATTNPDGSVDPFGRLIGLRKATEEEFENLKTPYVVGDGSEITATTVELSPVGEVSDELAEAKTVLGQMCDDLEATVASGSKAQGRSFEEIFKKYSGLGISFVPSDNGDMGNVYYNGELMDGLVDNAPNGAAFSFKFKDTGRGVANVVYDDNGEMIGIEVR
jgi:antirepressor regulating drug resistance, predicted signal transduction N-terminal membrane component